MAIDNTEDPGVTLFWQSTAKMNTLTSPWAAYDPYIYTRINNTET